jgi:5-methylthioadenosine/S-adenosylhomocysteine deaminase
MASNKRTVIRGATVLTMDPKIGDFQSADILIEDGRILAVRPGIDADGAEQVDAAGMIALPGFVDTHRHVWQTQLRTVATDWSLCDYVINMRSVYAAFYRPEDVYLGNLVGSLEAINSGITSLVDHCHIIHSPEHADASVEAHLAAGVGGVYCYGLFRNAKHVAGLPIDVAELVGEMFGDVEDWRFEDAARVRDKYFGDSSRLQFGLATNELEFKAADEAKEEIERARSLGPRRMSLHAGMGAMQLGREFIRTLCEEKLLDEDCLFVHGGGFGDQELKMLADHGCAISSTPDTEMQMGMGHPVAMRYADAGGRSALGIDIVSNIAGDMFAQMRLQLQAQRAYMNAKQEVAGRMPGKIGTPARSVLELATMGGARAIGAESRIGSLTPGKDADLILIDTGAINMTPVIDPVGAVVFYANASNVDSVFIRGEAVKRKGVLVKHDWNALRPRLVESSERIMQLSRRIPLSKIQHLWQSAWHFDGGAAARSTAMAA